MRNKKKGFTLVELLVVIAILAILATVAIVGYTSFTKKASLSNDEAVMAQINLLLQAGEQEGKPATLHEALVYVRENGFDVTKLKPTADEHYFVYNQEKNRLEYKDKLEGLTSNNWVLCDVSEAKEKPYSVYLTGNKDNETELTVNAGVDVGDVMLSTINYTNTGSAQNVVIRTNGGTLIVNDTTGGKQYFYGYAENSDVTTGTSCFEVFGAIKSLALKAGKAVIQKSGVVVEVSSESVSSAVIENNGYVAKNYSSIQISGSKAIGAENYKIGNLAELKAFRDAVNGDFDFEGLTVELTADIELTEAWTPIGDINHNFAGTFNGNNHSIKGLKNPETGKGAKASTSKDEFAFGFFGVLQNGGLISNIRFENVAIDTTQSYSSKHTGTLVGLVDDCRSFDKITVESGSVKFAKKGGGIIGRYYSDYKGNTNDVISISNCINRAAVTCTGENEAAAGIVGFVSISHDDDQFKLYKEFTISNCVNYGDISIVGGASAGIFVHNSLTDSPKLGVKKTNGNYSMEGGYQNETVYYENNCYNLGNISNTNGRASNLVGDTTGNFTHSDLFDDVWYSKTIRINSTDTKTFVPAKTSKIESSDGNVYIGAVSGIDCGISDQFTYGGKTYKVTRSGEHKIEVK